MLKVVGSFGMGCLPSEICRRIWLVGKFETVSAGVRASAG